VGVDERRPRKSWRGSTCGSRQCLSTTSTQIDSAPRTAAAKEL
jgi:hypothetical protein